MTILMGLQMITNAKGGSVGLDYYHLIVCGLGYENPNDLCDFEV